MWARAPRQSALVLVGVPEAAALHDEQHVALTVEWFWLAVVQRVQLVVGAHVYEVAAVRGLHHVLGAAQDVLALRRGGAAGRAGGDRHSSTRRVWITSRWSGSTGDQAACAAVADQADGDHARQRLARRRAAQAGALHNLGLDHGPAGAHLQRGDRCPMAS
jgi:hypothetical protein